MNTNGPDKTVTRMSAWTMICALSLLSLSCEQKNDQQELKAAIEEANAKWMEAIRQQNADALATMYTDDSYVLAPNMPAIQGPEGAKTFFRGAMQSGVKGIRLLTEEVEGNDE